MATREEIDAIDRARIAQAERFVASLFMGQRRGTSAREAWVKVEKKSLGEAIAAARAMDQELGAESGGRRAMVFGIEQSGRETFIPPALYPTPTEQEITMDQNTTNGLSAQAPEPRYTNRQNARRAAGKAGYSAEAFEIFQDGQRFGWRPVKAVDNAPLPVEEKGPELTPAEKKVISKRAAKKAEAPAPKRGRTAAPASKTSLLRNLVLREGGATREEMLAVTKGGHHDWDWPTVSSYISWFKTPKGGGLTIEKDGDTFKASAPQG